MRTLKAVVGLVVLFVLIGASPAHAWWDWLDDLSGPGPFNGVQLDFRVLCVMNQPSLLEANLALARGQALTLPLLREHDELRRRLENLGGATLRSRSDVLETAKNLAKLVDDIEGPVPPSPNRQLATQALRDAAQLLRTSAVPKTSSTKFGLWASCRDRLAHEPVRGGGDPRKDLDKHDPQAVDKLPADWIRHEDRHEVMSLIVNYRILSNVKSLWMVGDPRNNQAYANGEKIYLNILEPKLSWPITGNLDILDIQTGAGIYWFSSKGFAEGSKTFTGYMVEPVRFDLHWPGKSVDDEGNPWKRLLYSVSYSAGVMLFPGGFKGNPFNADAAHAHDIPGSEALFEMGVVINVGRVIGF
jgi:hypothetical protein